MPQKYGAMTLSIDRLLQSVVTIVLTSKVGRNRSEKRPVTIDYPRQCRKDHVNSQVLQYTIEREGGDVEQAAKVYGRGDVSLPRLVMSKHCVMENLHAAHLL